MKDGMIKDQLQAQLRSAYRRRPELQSIAGNAARDLQKLEQEIFELEKLLEEPNSD